MMKILHAANKTCHSQINKSIKIKFRKKKYLRNQKFICNLYYKYNLLNYMLYIIICYYNHSN